MKWQGRERSSNIEDRRSQGGGGLGGGFGGGMGSGGGFRIPTSGRAGGGLGGIGLIVVIGIICLALGINPLSLLDGSLSTSNSSFQESRPLPNAGQDQLADFVGVVVKDTETVWTDIFKANGATYVPPKVVLFSSQTQSGCGVADANSGPFYCPNDQKVTSISRSTTSCASSSALRATSPRLTCWPMKSATTCRTSLVSSPNSTAAARR